RLVAIKDNGGGMKPPELCDLLSKIGRSAKKTVPWTNGQFGFGVHAFRAFAKTVTFTSNTEAAGQYAITIDRDTDENTYVVCEPVSRRTMGKIRGTLVEVSHFDSRVFRKSQMRKKLAIEIERHFGEVLRAGVARIVLTQDGAQPHKCRPFDYQSLAGVPICETVELHAEEATGTIRIDLRVLEKQLSDDSHLPVLAKKGRRVQTIAQLASFRSFVRDQGGNFGVWSTLFVTGSIDVGEFCDPTITRDDLRQDSRTATLYDHLVLVQLRVEEEVEKLLQRHGREGCFVWGRVPDMREWLKAADIALVPLEIGRGVQNKVLEAMAMELPVVLTPEAATGIDARDGREFAVRETDTSKSLGRWSRSPARSPKSVAGGPAATSV
ncbi:MAG: glycosyltransferase, partial [Gemmatimonadetes bacterium]|nr:glycosyltransferase [Gemmatimonadota bacterium]